MLCRRKIRERNQATQSEKYQLVLSDRAGDLANDHRTAKMTLDVCTPLEKLTQGLSDVAQTQRIKSGVCMWTAPQPQESHSACVSMTFKSRTLIRLHVRHCCPHVLTQSRPVVVLHRNSALKLWCSAIIPWLPGFFLLIRS